MSQPKQEFELDIPRSPWDMASEMLREDGSMICAMRVRDQKEYGLDVQWGPYGFQRTFFPHQDPYSARDCRACRHLVKMVSQAALMRRKFKMQVMGIFAVALTETGEVRMVPVRP